MKESENPILKENAPCNPIVHPWSRYWARIFDTNLFILLVIPAWSIFFSLRPSIANKIMELRQGGDLFIAWVSVFLYVFVEPLLLSVWGTTPGKWFLKIRVRYSNNDKISYADAFERSSRIWLWGMVGWVPVLPIISLYLNYRDLKKNGKTSWDRAGKFVVSHEDVSLGRSAVFSLLLISIAIILGVLTALGS